MHTCNPSIQNTIKGPLRVVRIPKGEFQTNLGYVARPYSESLERHTVHHSLRVCF